MAIRRAAIGKSGEGRSASIPLILDSGPLSLDSAADMSGAGSILYDASTATLPADSTFTGVGGFQYDASSATLTGSGDIAAAGASAKNILFVVADSTILT